MKKLIVIAFLVIALTIGVFAVPAMAAPPPKTSTPATPIMEAGSGRATVETGYTVKVFEYDTGNYVHVSLTVGTDGMLHSGDEVYVIVVFEEPGDWPGDNTADYKLLGEGDSDKIATVEFDAARGIVGWDDDTETWVTSTWKLVVVNATSGYVDIDLWWNYTITSYPASSSSSITGFSACKAYSAAPAPALLPVTAAGTRPPIIWAPPSTLVPQQSPAA